MNHMNKSNLDYRLNGPQINQFNNIAPNPIPRSSFKRDFTTKSTFNADQLVPIFIDEILPGDDLNISMTTLTRMATPIKPLMDNLYLETFWFFVPNRLVWQHWEQFQGQQNNPTDSVAYTIPTISAGSTYVVGDIYDQFGLPSGSVGMSTISALPFRAYNLIYNEWFKDENLENALPVSTTDGPDAYTTYTLAYRNKRKDYLTSCLPWPQKGTAVSISLGNTAPLVFPTTMQVNAIASHTALGTTAAGQFNVTSVTTDVGANINFGGTQANTYGITQSVISPTDAYANLAAATPITINALRQAALYQQILELDARGGTRYVEGIFARFGVVSPDFRLQRPELIGMGSTRINVYAVPQTAPSPSTATSNNAQGNLAGFGTGISNGEHRARYSATEHGYIIGIANVRADLTYQQNVDKMWTRSTRLDFYEPLQNGLGEQTVLNQEIYATGSSTDTQPFGYQERFSEYRFKNSQIKGLFRSTAPTPLDIWHLSQNFGVLPTLGPVFIGSNTPMSRIQAVNSDPSFLSDMFFNYTHVRPIPIRSNPGITRL